MRVIWTWCVSGAIGIVLSIGVSQAQSSSIDIVERWFKEADQLDYLNASYGELTHDDASNTTTANNVVLDFKLTFGEEGSDQLSVIYNIRLGAVNWRDLAETSTHYTSSEISAENLELTFSDTSDTPQTSTGGSSGVVMRDVKFARWPTLDTDPNKPISRYYPLVKAAADYDFSVVRLNDFKLTQELVSEGLTSEISYGAIEYRDSVAGRIAEGSIGPIRVTVKPSSGQAGEAGSFLVEPVIFRDYDAAAFARYLDPAATDQSGKYGTVVESIEIGGVKGSFDGGSFSVGKMLFENWGMRHPGVPLLARADAMLLNALARGEPDPKDLAEVIGKLYGAFRIGKFSVADIKVDPPEPGGGGLSLIAMNDLSADGLGGFEISGLSLDGPDGETVRLGSFTIKDVGFPELNALINFEQAAEEENIPEILKAIPTIGDIAAKDIQVAKLGEGEFSLKSLTYHMEGFIGPIPTLTESEVDTLTIPVAILDAEEREQLQALGYDTITLSDSVKLKWDEATEKLTLDFRLDLRDGGKLDLAASAGGIKRSIIENPETAQQALGFLTVDSASISYEDASLVDRVLKTVAAQQGLTPDVMRQQAIGLVSFGLQTLNNPDLTNRVTAAVTNFLEKKGTISITAAPDTPVLVVQIIGMAATAPGAIADLLKVDVRSTP